MDNKFKPLIVPGMIEEDHSDLNIEPLVFDKEEQIKLEEWLRKYAEGPELTEEEKDSWDPMDDDVPTKEDLETDYNLRNTYELKLDEID